MITLFSGPPGGGKSFHLVDEGLQRVRRRPVIANFPITRPPDKWYFMEQPDVGELVAMTRFWDRRRESQALLLIDEASRYFNSRDWNRDYKKAMDWVTFFSQHRKLGYDVILVAQSDRMLDRQIRANIEIEVKHLRANSAWLFKWCPWPLFFLVQSWYAVPAMKHSINMMAYWPWVGRRYDTMRLFHDIGGPEVQKLLQLGSVASMNRSAAGRGRGPGVPAAPAVSPASLDT